MRWSARTGLLHPAWWLATGLLLLNDHYLKGAGLLAPWLTGKLSDFAGMMMAPLVVAALLAPRSRRGFLLAHVLVGLGFSALKLSSWCAALWCEAGALLGLTWRVASDPTDLLALPVLGLSYRIFGSAAGAEASLATWQPLVTGVAHSIGFVSIVATSSPPPARPVIAPTPPGNVYVMSGERMVELERSTGRRERSLACEVYPALRPHHGVRIHGHILYSADYRRVAACDLRAGRQLWTLELEQAEMVHADDQRVLVRSPSSVMALVPATGVTSWRRELENLNAAVLAERVVIHSTNRSLTFVSLDDGRALGHGGALATQLVSLAGNLYGFDAGELWVLNSAGSVERRTSHGLADPQALLAMPGATTLVVASEVGTGGVGTLTGISPDELRPLWRLGDGAVVALTRRAMLTRGREGCDESKLDVRELRTGRKLWQIPWCSRTAAAEADDDLVVTVHENGSGSSLVVARALSTGQTLWQTRLPN